jgi:hypothetical protein
MSNKGLMLPAEVSFHTKVAYCIQPLCVGVFHEKPEWSSSRDFMMLLLYSLAVMGYFRLFAPLKPKKAQINYRLSKFN